MARRMHEGDIAIVLIAILLAALLLFSFSWGFGHMGGMMFFGPVFMILVLVLIVWLIISLAQGGRR